MTEISQALAVADVLEAAAALLEKPGAWTQKYWALDEYGNQTSPRSPDAVCWCIDGAVIRAKGSDDTFAEMPMIAGTYDSILGAISWNDVKGRTQAEVVAALRAAAQKARGRELAAESVK